MRLFILFIFLVATSSAYAQQASLVDIEKAMEVVRAKEKELVAKEQELNAREEQLNTMQKDLIARENELKTIRAEIAQMLNQVSEENENELAGLAKIYGSTKAKSAAATIIKMDIYRSAEIIKRMTTMNAGKLMSEIAKQDPVYASRLSTVLSGGEDPLPRQIEVHVNQ